MTVDMAGWPREVVEVLDVRLDPANVRLERADTDASQPDLMADLFKNEDALSLADSITRVGFLTNEVPIVLREADAWTVVEGNRRFAALKALQNPLLAGDAAGKVAAMRERMRDPDSLARVEAIVAPSRDEAERVVAAIHTGKARKKWLPARQAAFFQAQIEDGRSYDDLRERYPTVDVKKYVLRARMLLRFREASRHDPGLAEFLSTKGWTTGLSTLARVWESKPFVELTGIGLDNQGNLTVAVSDDVFDAMARHVVDGMRTGAYDTRKLNAVSAPAFQQMLRVLGRIKSQAERPSETAGRPAGMTERDTPAAAGRLGPVSVGGAAPPERETGASARPMHDLSDLKAERKRQLRHPIQISCPSYPRCWPEALAFLAGELTTINVREHPNLTAIGLRSLLERTIKAYAHSWGGDGSLRSRARGKVQLKDCLDWFQLDSGIDLPLHGLRDVVRNIRSDKVLGDDFPGTIGGLNAITHNPGVGFSPEQAMYAWGAMEPLIQFMVTSPEPEPDRGP